MTRNVTALTPGDSLAAALLLFRRKGLRRTPVVEEGMLVGMLTERDILRAAGPVETGRLVGVVTDSDLLRVFVQQNSSRTSTRVTLIVPSAEVGEGTDPVRLCLATGMRLRALSACDHKDGAEILTMHVDGAAVDDLVERLSASGYRVLEREDA